MTGSFRTCRLGGSHSRVAGCLNVEEASSFACLVLLTEPGAGKSTVLRTLSEGSDLGACRRVSLDLVACSSDAWLIRRLFEAEDMREWLTSGWVLEVTLDSLDECRLSIPNVAALLSDELRRWPTGRLRLRIGCRSADWPASLGQALGTIFPGAAMLELLPLRRRDVPAFADEAGVDRQRVPRRLVKGQRRAHGQPTAQPEADASQFCSHRRAGRQHR
ncbi:MAG: hypothetical protein M3083_10490 [Actinomycetota bacterium]|nr:hypothetical protein [Actinomycetota bacterium]